MKKEQIIPFEKLLNRGVQTDNIRQIDTSFFYNIYEQTFPLVKTICNASKRAVTSENQSNPDFLYESHNVIAFTGRRGTGKTSAMLTVANYLCSIENVEGSLSLQELRKENYFYHLGFIDASVLDEKEDVFLILLSKMYNYLRRFEEPCQMYEGRAYDKQNSLKENICRLYDHYTSLKTDDGLKLNSSYNLMDKLSDRFGVRREFSDLVKEYISLLNEKRTKDGRAKNGHLVICLDDIDMTQQSHMRIMQCIHQYLMIPNVIVMITLNFPILSAALQRDNFTQLKTGNADKDALNLHLSFEQTQEFLRKVIPSDMRITMPSWKKKDYKELFTHKVRLKKDDNSEGFEKTFERLDGSILFKKMNSTDAYMLSPKELILMLLAERTKIYLDAFGNKTHFMEPDSLRNLYDMFYMLYSMNNILPEEPKKDDDDHLYYDHRKANRKILLDHLNFKMLPEYDFSLEERHLIDALVEEPIERRGKRIWDYYYTQLRKASEERRIRGIYGDDYYNDELSRFKIENYSLGEVFRILHTGSRIGLLDKKLVKFILASFSFSLPQFVEREKWKNHPKNTNRDKEQTHYRKLRDIFQYTLLGTWCNDLFNGHYVDAVLYKDDLVHIFALDDEKKAQIINYDSYFEPFFTDLICLFLMSSLSTREEFIVKSGVDDNKKELNSIYSIEARIDPTSFIMNSLRIEERFKNMRFRYKDEVNPYKYVKHTHKIGSDTTEYPIYGISSLLNAILNENNVALNEQSCKDCLKTILKENAVFFKEEVFSENFCKSFVEDLSPAERQKYLINECFRRAMYQLKKRLKNQSDTLWFFLKHTDLSYNVIKRAVSYIIYQSDNNLKEKRYVLTSPFYTIQKFYGLIYEKLCQQDELYFNEVGYYFSEKFAKHPIVKKFATFEEGKLNEDNNNYLGSSGNACGIYQGSSVKLPQFSPLLIFNKLIGYIVKLSESEDDCNSLLQYCNTFLNHHLDERQRDAVALSFLEYNNTNTKERDINNLALRLRAIVMKEDPIPKTQESPEVILNPDSSTE